MFATRASITELATTRHGHSLRKFLAPFAVLGVQAALAAEVTRSFGKVIKSLGWRLKFRRKMYLCVQKVT